MAALRLGAGPLLLLADHRAAPSVRLIWEVPSIDDAERELGEAGWKQADRVELPEGPCLLLSDPSGNDLGLLERTRSPFG